MWKLSELLPSCIRDLSRVLSTGLAFYAGLTTSAVAEAAQCGNPMFRIAEGASETAQTLCATASDISDALGDCGLQQRRPVTIEVVDRLHHRLGNCLGYFDCEYDVIHLAAPAAYSTILDADDPYALLPEDVLTKALLTHELTHALASQSAGERKIDIVDQEYIAAAMELDLMEPGIRSVFLNAEPLTVPPSEDLIDIWIYGFEPRKFAVNAWRHFRQPHNGCQLVKRILSGEKSFAREVRPELR